MAGLLSNLVGNFVEGIQKTKCKYGDDSKTCEKCGVKYKVDLIEYKFLCRNKKCQKHFDEDLKKTIYTDFLNMISASLLCSSKEVFTHMNMYD